MKKTIICFGDSNTYGYDPVSFGRLDENKRWPQVLAYKLGDAYHVIEEGLCGRTTAFNDPLNESLSGLDYITPCLLSHGPVDLLIIMLGTNDTKERFGATAENITNGLKRLVLKAKATDCWRDNSPSILLIAPAPIDAEYDAAMFNGEMGTGCSEKSYALAPLYKALAHTLNCYFLDAKLFAKVHPNDYMHIDETGHSALAIAIKNTISSLNI